MVYGRNHFCANITTTQLSESFNSHLRHYLKSTNNVLEFFSHFEKLLENLRHNELDSNYNMSQRLPILRVEVLLLKNSRDVYTPKIFNFFQKSIRSLWTWFLIHAMIFHHCLSTRFACIGVLENIRLSSILQTKQLFAVVTNLSLLGFYVVMH